TGRAHFNHSFNRRQTNHRHIKSHVLIGFGNLYHGEASTDELPGPANHGVGAFHGFDGDAGAFAHDYGLTQIEARNLVRYPAAVIDVTTLTIIGFALTQSPRLRQLVLEEIGRVD